MLGTEVRYWRHLKNLDGKMYPRDDQEIGAASSRRSRTVELATRRYSRRSCRAGVYESPPASRTPSKPRRAARRLIFVTNSPASTIAAIRARCEVAALTKKNVVRTPCRSAAV